MAHGLSDLPARITLRPVSSSDRDFLLQLYASTRDDELALVAWTDAEKAAFLEQQFEAQSDAYRGYTNAECLIILADGVSAGRLYVARWTGEIRIMDIALLPEYRGAGIGTRLLGELLEEAARDGKKVSIHVEKHNSARRLYERLGFAPVAERGIYLFLEASP